MQCNLEFHTASRPVEFIAGHVYVKKGDGVTNNLYIGILSPTGSKVVLASLQTGKIKPLSIPDNYMDITNNVEVRQK